MKLIFHKHLCVLMAALLMLLPLSTCAQASEQKAFSYPEGVSAAKAEEIISATDSLLLKATQTMTDKSLSDTVLSMLYDSNLLSSVTVGIYKTLNTPEMAEMLSALSVSTTPSDLSAVLFAYPEVSAALAGASSWETADLSEVSWGIRSKNDFALAFGTVLSPLHPVLQLLLCEGSYKIVGNLIKFNGGNGYETAIIPVYEAFGCTTYRDYATFKSQAAANAQTLGANLIYPILDYVEELLESPLVNLCDALPNIADFILSDGFENTINALLAPITELAATIEKIPLLNTLLAGSIFPDLGEDFAGNLVPDINDMLGNADTGLSLPAIDWELLRSCGTPNGNRLASDKGKTFVVVFRWLWEVLQSNSDALSELLTAAPDDGNAVADMDISAVLGAFLQDDADTVLRAMAFMLKPELEPFDLYWVYGKTETTAFPFTQDMPRENYTKMTEGFNNLLGSLIAEMTGSASLSEGLQSSLYTNDNITAVVKTVYSLLNGEQMQALTSLIAVDASPKAVLAQLTEEQFKPAVSFLSRYNTWDEIPADGISWGFADGDKTAFINTVAAVLRPLQELMSFLFAGADFVFLDSITIRGANGYNSAVIPLFEALGIPADKYVSFDEYRKAVGTDAVLTSILTPVFDQLETICAAPVTYLTEQLPTICYFISDGGLQKMLYSLASPLLIFIEGSGLSIDLLAMFEEMIPFDLTFGEEQVNKLMDEMKNSEDGIGIALPALPALRELASLGTMKEIDSKRTFEGRPTKSVVIEADKESVLAYLVDFIVSLMQMPENATMLTDTMMGGAEEGGENPFAAYTDTFASEMDGMTHDDMVKWFYDMVVFESEPVQQEEEQKTSEVPQIIYEAEEESSHTGTVLLVLAVLAAAVLLTVLLVKRKKKNPDSAPKTKTKTKTKSKKNKTEE